MPKETSDDVRWLEPEQLEVWFQLQAIAEYLPAMVDAQLRRDAGLTRYDYFLMAMLSESPDRQRLMSELAVVTNASLSRLSHAVAKLEGHGWLTRHTFPDDRRATVATLTDEGMRKVERSAPQHVENVRNLIFDHLTPAQTRALGAAIEPVIAALGLPQLPAVARPHSV